MVVDDDDDSAPLTLSIDKDAAIEGGGRVHSWLVGAQAPALDDAWAPPVYAMASGKAGLFAVGAKGAVLRWANGGFTAQQSPTDRRLNAVWLDDDSVDGWAGGEDGVVLRRDPVTGWQSFPSPTNASIIDLVEVNGEMWLLDAASQLWRRVGDKWNAVNIPQGQWRSFAVQLEQGSGGASSVLTTTVWLAGDDGAVAHGTSVTSNQWTWQSIPGTPKGVSWTDISVAPKRVWLVGTQGTVGWLQAGSLQTAQTPSTGTLHDAHVTPSGDGLVAVGDGGRWVEVSATGAVVERQVAGAASDLHALAWSASGWIAAGAPALRLGPMLPMPQVSKPTETTNISDEIVWTYPKGPAAELQRVQITTYWRQNYWTLYGHDDITTAPLADFQQLGGWSPLPDGPLRVRVWRMLGPELNLNHFNHKEISPAYWRSWSMNWLLSQK